MGSNRSGRAAKLGKNRPLKRKRAFRSPYDRVLIVCEGEKTEPYYFEGARDFFKLNSANIVIPNCPKNDPIGIWRHAHCLYKASIKEGNPYDKVYCVFDCDDPNLFSQAVNAIKSAKPSGVFVAATSIPCFEYWILLHFKNHTAPFHASQRRTVADAVMSSLRTEHPTYTKAARSLFEDLSPKRQDASKRSERRLKDACDTNEPNPSTNVHELVAYLSSVKQRN